MALENATYVNGLVPSNPLSTDTVAQADDHLRLIKQVLVNTFPNLSGPVTSTQSTLNSPVPSGVIVMWSGAITAIPSGWYLCNGSNNTPDLRDRFVVGAGSSYAVGATGGANTVTLTTDQIPSHTHSITAATDVAGSHTHAVSDPGHNHSYTVSGSNSAQFGYSGGYGYGSNGAATSVSGTGISIQANGSHAHNVTATAASTGGGQAHENRPPYYALAYIMKA